MAATLTRWWRGTVFSQGREQGCIKLALFASTSAWEGRVGCGEQKAGTEEDVRNKRERYKNSWSLCKYVHNLPSDTSTCILHPRWYKTGSEQPKHQKEKNNNLLSSLSNQPWRKSSEEAAKDSPFPSALSQYRTQTIRDSL